MSSSNYDPLTSSPPSAKASSSSHLPSSSNADFSAHDSALSLSDPTPDPSSIAIADPSNVAYFDHDDAQEEPEEEEFFDDGDSAFGGSLIGCDTDTLASYITDYRYENGRRYHAYQDGEYWGANDESANELQDLAHHMYLMTLEGKLHLAPLENPHNILDLGTGTGIWAIEMADAYPSAHVVGTDLSPIQPLFVPPNLNFEIEDLTKAWTYPKSHFDFIHIRELFGCVPDWTFFFSQVYSHLKPGGYVEILEHSVWPVSDDDTVNENSFFTLWGRTVVEMGDRFGKSFCIWEESKERLEKAGFVDVKEVRYKWPMNGWPSPEHRTHGDDGGKDWRRLRELGVWNQLRLYDGVETFMLRLLTAAGGWSYERAQVFLAEMRRALKDTKVHGYLDVTVVYGRRPGGDFDQPEVEAEAFDEIGFGHVEAPGTSTATAPVEMEVVSTPELMTEPEAASLPPPTAHMEVEMAGTTELSTEPMVASKPVPIPEPMEIEMTTTTELVTEPTLASTLEPIAEPMEMKGATTAEPVKKTPPVSTSEFTAPTELGLASAIEPTKEFAVEGTSTHIKPEEVGTAGATEPMKEFTVGSTSTPTTEPMFDFTAPTAKANEPLITPTTEITETPAVEPVLKTTSENLP